MRSSPRPLRKSPASRSRRRNPKRRRGEAAPADEPIAVLLASANLEAGEAVLKKCAACHTIEKGGANKIGPNLWDIVNRPIASHEGFAYSAAMKEFSQGGSVKWDYDHLTIPDLAEGLVKGTAMGFAGRQEAQERADLIAYLRTLSDSPAPLPDAAAPPPKTQPPLPKAAAPAPAEGRRRASCSGRTRACPLRRSRSGSARSAEPAPAQ